MIHLFEAIKANPGYFKQLTCKELLFTQYECPQEALLQDLFSEHNYIAYVISGRRFFFQPGYQYEMTEGKCVFSKKGGWLAQKEPGEGWCVLVFFIPDSYLKQFIKEYRQHLSLDNLPKKETRSMMLLSVNDTTRSFFYSMLPYFTQSPPPPESLLEIKFRELLFNLLINPGNIDLLTYLCTLADCAKQPIEEIMNANYTYNLSLNDFAKLCYRSPASFKREFKEIFHTTPGKWLMQRRLEYASLLLKNPSKNITDAALECGFENAAHFSRVFKEKFGLSPLQYKKQQTTSPTAV